jgi:hypothetical protein
VAVSLTVRHINSGWTATADDMEDARDIVRAEVRRSFTDGPVRSAFEYTITTHQEEQK